MQKIIYPVILNEDLPFYLTGVGVCEYENNVVRENGLVSHQFLVTLDGEGVLEVDGERFLQTKNSCFYLSPGVPHKYHARLDSWKTAWVVFRGSMIGEIMKKLGFKDYNIGVLNDSAAF